MDSLVIELKKRLSLGAHQVDLWCRLGNHFMQVAQGSAILDEDGIPFTGGARVEAWKEAEICFWAARYLKPLDPEVRRAWWSCYVRNRVKLVHDEDKQKSERNRLSAKAEIKALAEKADSLIPNTLRHVSGNPKRLEEELRVCLNALEREGAV